jgi:hypothetical protein
MFGDKRPSSDDEIIHWLVNLNTDIRMIEMHASSTLAAFKCQVTLSYGLKQEETLTM